jgi:O-antigen ligase
LLPLSAGGDSWSLDRWGTARALLALSVFAASWLLASTLTSEARTTLLRFVLLSAFVMALLGFAQAAAGRHSSLRLYDFHHEIGAIGTFSNRNHFADLMAMLIPFALAMGKQEIARDRKTPVKLPWWGLTVVLFLAAALSFSRTGFALACVALVAGWLVQPGSGNTAGDRAARWAAPVVVAASCVLAVGYYAWQGIVQRLEQDPLDDLRWQYLANGLATVRAHFPWGSGFGSVRDPYAPFEPVAEMGRSFALHAHNEALETAIEGGLPGMLLLIAGIGLIAWAATKALARRRHSSRLVVAAAVATGVPLLHSLVDYPLRTLAVASVFGLVLAVLLAPPGLLPDAVGGH